MVFPFRRQICETAQVQKSEYVFDVVVPAGAVETGGDAFGCCTVFSSLTLHAPSAATREARTTMAKGLIVEAPRHSRDLGNGRSWRGLRGTMGRGSALVF
jgi:hypothetical protein